MQICSLCDSNDIRGMVIRLETTEHLCRRCISEGQRAEILSIKTYYDCRIETDLQASNQREEALQANLQAAKQREQALQADLQAAKQREQELQADLTATNSKSAESASTQNMQLEVLKDKLESQAKQAKDDHQCMSALSQASQAELQSLKSDYTKLKESNKALLLKHQLSCHQAKWVDAQLETEHDQLVVSNQTIQRIEAELRAAQGIASEQHHRQNLLEQELEAKESSILQLRSCNSEIVKRLKRSQQGMRDLESVIQNSKQPYPDGSLCMYIKELLPGKCPVVAMVDSLSTIKTSWGIQALRK